MKQTLFMVVVTAIGVLGCFISGPFVGVCVYYLFAVLRPQSLWEWVLPPGVTWSYYVAMTTLLVTFGTMAGAIARDDPKVPLSHFWTRSHTLLVGFGVWVVLSYFGALNREVAYFWFNEYIKIFVMFIVGGLMIRTSRQAWIMCVTCTLALGYIAYEINMVYLQQGYLSIYRRGYGGLDNNGAGLMLAMGVPLALFLWEGTRKWWRWGFAALVPLLLHAVFMSYSRGAMLSLVLATPLVVLRARRRVQFAGALLGIAILVPMLAGQEIRDRFFTVKQYQEDDSAQSRFDSWNAALHIAYDYPILGAGIRNANLLSHQYGADMEGRTIHSQFLQIAADNGFVGVGLYLAAIASAWFGLRRVRKMMKARSDLPSRDQYMSMAAGLEISLVVFCIGSVFLSLEVFELPYLLILLAGQVHGLARAEAPANAQAQVQAPPKPSPFPRPEPGRPRRYANA